ncbi:MAG: poly-gamma-glutamate system protein [Bacteroidota bacterium]
MKLFITLLIILAGTLFVGFYNTRNTELPYAATMREAASLAQEWFTVIELQKRERGIRSDTYSNVPNHFMIGDDWSDITTTLGSLEAKEAATNPDFSALVVRLLHEAGIQQDDTVGVILSGSFPSISISVLAALQTLGIDAVVMSSLGASTYGANQPEATWIDMERWIRRKGGLKYRSELVSMGAGHDNGNGLQEEGRIALQLAAERNHLELYIPESVTTSIMHKTDLLSDGGISLLINVGGNMAAMGACAHSLNIPNGLNLSMKTCSDTTRGIISRLSEKGMPFIQFLNIKELAVTYGIDMAPGNRYADSTNLYHTTRSNRLVSVLVLIFCVIPIAFLKKEVKKTARREDGQLFN